MYRQNWQEFWNMMSGGWVACNCGVTLQTQQGVREHWQLGHFDTPVYKEVNDKEDE